MINQALRAYLLTKTAITALIGTGGNARIWKARRPQRNVQYPCITYQTISDPHEHVLSGAAGMATPRVQIDCWSDDPVTCETLSDAVRDAMDGFTGTMGSTAVRAALFEDGRDLDEPPVDASDEGVYRRSDDYIIMHDESLPTFA